MTDEGLYIGNYAVAFIDLLGQRDDMRRHRILPDDKTEAVRIVKESVGKILEMHKRFKSFYEAFEGAPSFFTKLTPEQQAQLGSMQPGKLHTQRFSDGLVVYASLAEDLNFSPINSLYGLLSSAGSLVLIQLAAGSPVRIGIDIGWGVELYPNELYGAALAHAYELESSVAQWPRVVVGNDLIEYIEQCMSITGNSLNDQYRRSMAAECLSCLTKDMDGQMIVDFAGEKFLSQIPENPIRNVLKEAHKFVDDQLTKWSAEGNVTLYKRYNCLYNYLNSRNKV